MAIKVISTRAELEALVVMGQPETAQLEFKNSVKNWNAPKGTRDEVKHEAQLELCRDFSQMANASGGHVVIGVNEGRAPDGLKVAESWAPISDPEAMKDWIESAVANCCVPSTFSKELKVVDVDGGRAIVATIFPSRVAVYVWNRHAKTIQCVTRTSTGKKCMNPDEMERHIMNGTRAARLSFDDAWTAKRQDDVILADGVWLAERAGDGVQRYRGETGPVRIQGVTDTTIQLVVPVDGAKVLDVPYTLLSHVWLDVHGRVCLMIGARLVFQGGMIALRHVR